MLAAGTPVASLLIFSSTPAAALVSTVNSSVETPAPGGSSSPASEEWTESSHTVINTDGSGTIEYFTGPVFHQHATTGEWRPINLDLELDDGVLSAESGPASLPRFALTSADEVVTSPSEAGEIIAAYPDAIDVPATYSGREVSFAGVFGDSRDLSLVLTTTGYEETVVLPSAEAPATYRVAFSLPAGVTAQEHGLDVEFVDGNRNVLATFGDGLASDSRLGSPGMGAEIPVWVRLLGQSAQGEGVVEVTIDSDWLQDSARVFPVVVDPVFNEGSQDGGFDGYVNSDNAGLSSYPPDRPQDGTYSSQIHLRTGSPGLCEWPEVQPPCNANRTRTFLRFPLTSLPAGAQIVSSTLQLFNYYSYDPAPAGATVYGTTSSATDSTTWTNQPGVDGYGASGGANFAYGATGNSACGAPQPPSSPTCGGQWVDFTGVGPLVTRWLSSGNNGLVLQADNERDRNSHRRYYSSEYGYGYSPRLSISFTNGNAAAVTSTTHPDQAQWYRQNASTQVRTEAPGRSGVATNWSWTYTLQPDTVPDTVPEYTGINGYLNWNFGGPLQEGTAYFHFRYDTGAGWSNTAHFRMNVDSVAPSPVGVIVSPSHNYEVTVPDATIDYTWQAATDATSGLAGYSWTFNHTLEPDPAADSTVDIGTVTSATSPALAEGSWYLHIQAVDRAGNVSTDRSHGGLLVDATPIGAPTISSSTHPDPNTWYAASTVDLTYTFPADFTGHLGTSSTIDQSPSTQPDTIIDPASSGATFIATSDGEYWAHVRGVDGVGNWGPTSHFRIRIGSVPGAPVITSTTHPNQSTWYASASPSFTWTKPTNSSTVASYSVVFDRSSATVPDTAEELVAAGGSWQEVNVADGEWWLHVRSRGTGGTWGPTGHYPVKIDTLAPVSPAIVTSTSHERGLPVPRVDMTAKWTPGADAHSGLAGYSFVINSSETTAADTLSDTTQLTGTSVALADGSWWLHVRAVDAAGNVGDDVAMGPYVVNRAAIDLPWIAYQDAGDEGCTPQADFYDPVNCAGPLDPLALPRLPQLDETRNLLGYIGPFYSPVVSGNAVRVMPETVSLSLTGTWQARGLVRNETSQPVGAVTVTARLFGLGTPLTGPAEVLLAEVSGLVPVEPLRPHEPAPFSLTSQLPAQAITRVEYSVATAAPSSTSRALVLSEYGRQPYGIRAAVDNYLHTDPTTGNKPYVFFGGAQNTGSATMPTPGVVLAWLDAQGRVISIASAPLSTGDGLPTAQLAQGKFGDFAVAVSAPDLGPALNEATEVLLWGVKL